MKTIPIVIDIDNQEDKMYLNVPKKDLKSFLSVASLYDKSVKNLETEEFTYNKNKLQPEFKIRRVIRKWQ
jgi:hypothetical protein